MRRVAIVRSFAKLNLDLRVLYRRPDNYHELRTIFQTVSLADTIGISYKPARGIDAAVVGNVDIPDNLLLRAAEAVLKAASTTGEVLFELNKRIPMGAGLGGGSSNAAAVLLALPALAGVTLGMDRLMQIGEALGSDVPFFLHGGTAAGVGRGTELFPLPAIKPTPALIVAPPIHVSTAEAYKYLNRTGISDFISNPALTTPSSGVDTEFRSLVWLFGQPDSQGSWEALCRNDFEAGVFQRQPSLHAIKTKLARLGARPALMTGSGSAVFGLFQTRDELDRAHAAFSTPPTGNLRTFRTTLIPGRSYRRMWRQQLAEHITTKQVWPPQSRYSQR